MEMSGQLHGPAALPQWKSTGYLLDRRLGEPQSRSGRGDEKNSQPIPGLESPDHPAHSPAPSESLSGGTMDMMAQEVWND
jgi:hypothetical protein